MTRKVAVIGMGHVGSTVAHYIVANGFADDLVLIDSNADKVNADALRLQGCDGKPASSHQYLRQ